MDLRMLIPIMGILLVMIPVAGLTLGLTLRYAVKPFVETLAAALRESGSGAGGHLPAQVDQLTDEIRLLSAEVTELRAAQSFDRELMAGKLAGTDEIPLD